MSEGFGFGTGNGQGTGTGSGYGRSFAEILDPTIPGIECFYGFPSFHWNSALCLAHGIDNCGYGDGRGHDTDEYFVEE